jgi:hypothetical protein
MPLAGTGMLLTSMDVDAADEGDFNRWYDREHLQERVAIEGFLEARRYVAHAGRPKYLSLYSTRTFEVLDSLPYRTALANQTAWSKQNIARFRNMIRAVARITISCGVGRGAAVGLVRLRPMANTAATLRSNLHHQIDSGTLDGIIAMHLLESDPVLSKPLTDNPEAASAGAGDWFVLIDGTDPDAIAGIIHQRFDHALVSPFATLVSTGTYKLMWDLTKEDLPTPNVQSDV